jgi:integrase
METINSNAMRHSPWNKGKLVGQKAPLKLKEIWAIRVRLQLAVRHRELALFNFARIVDSWFRQLGLDKASYGTHTLRRTKATLIYRRTKNLRAVQLLLGHTKLESTVRYLGIEVNDALEMAEQTDV